MTVYFLKHEKLPRSTAVALLLTHSWADHEFSRSPLQQNERDMPQPRFCEARSQNNPRMVFLHACRTRRREPKPHKTMQRVMQRHKFCVPPILCTIFIVQSKRWTHAYPISSRKKHQPMCRNSKTLDDDEKSCKFECNRATAIYNRPEKDQVPRWNCSLKIKTLPYRWQCRVYFCL